MVYMSTREIVAALKTLQDMCKHTSCEKCICSNNGGQCMVMRRAPMNWKLVDPEEVIKVMK